ncbi:MAG: 30S ribosomal protein S12 methylthiotransferase RimO [Phycisphaerales bacterium]|nr:30S ribosomal protein S12 methylthiotransferase RimO [Phycisphaerales bacterium]
MTTPTTPPATTAGAASPQDAGARPEQSIETVSFVSLGCPKNLVDSEKMLGLLAEDGIRPVGFDAEDEQQVDAVVINTCGFLEASKEESLQVIREAVERKQRGEVKRVVVAGCLVQRHRAKMLAWAPGIDAMIGVFDRDHIVRAVRGEASEREAAPSTANAPKYWIAANALQAARDRGMQSVGLTVQGKDGKGLSYFEDDRARLRLTPRHYAYLKVSEGCNQRCAFCTIPSIRGKMRSKPIERILEEARELLDDGAFEINLIGQDTTSWGDDIGCGFVRSGDGHRGGLPMLLERLHDCVATHGGGQGWLRLMYAYPSNFADEMIDAIANLPHVCNYIDIPLQHASERMLQAMRRNVSAAHQRALVERLRERVPGVAIRTTFISGFPGETEDDHEELLGFVEEAGFDAVGVFTYSHEAGTPAGTMEDDPALAVAEEVKARRRDEIMALQQRLAFEQAAFVAEQWDAKQPASSGCIFDVLIDKPLQSETRGIAGLAGLAEHGGTGGRAKLHQGRTYFQAPDVDAATYVVSREALSPGELVRCAVVASDGYDLVARPVRELSVQMSLPIMHRSH